MAREGARQERQGTLYEITGIKDDGNGPKQILENLNRNEKNHPPYGYGSCRTERVRQAARTAENRQRPDGRRNRRRTAHARSDVEDAPRRLVVALARRHATALHADGLQHGRKPRRDDRVDGRNRHRGMPAADRRRIELRGAAMVGRRAVGMVPLGPQRLDAGMADGGRRDARAADYGRRRRRGNPRRGGIRRGARRKTHLVGADRPCGGTQIVGRPQRPARIESPHLRRSDGPPLGLLG